MRGFELSAAPPVQVLRGVGCFPGLEVEEVLVGDFGRLGLEGEAWPAPGAIFREGESI